MLYIQAVFLLFSGLVQILLPRQEIRDLEPATVKIWKYVCFYKHNVYKHFSSSGRVIFKHIAQP